jgi:hypothetical protein
MGWAAALALVVGLGTGGRGADEPGSPEGVDSDAVKAKVKALMSALKDDQEKHFRDFAEVTKGTEKLEGLFTLHHKDDHLYAEIRPHQFNQPMLAPIAIAQGMAMAGNPLNFGDEWVVLFKRVGDKVQLIRRNVHYKAPPGSPLDKAVKQNYTDSVLMALPIISINQAGGQSVLIDLADIFFSNFADFGWWFGSIDRSRTNWHKIKAFKNNIELEVEATFSSGGRFFSYFDDGVADTRGRTIVIHYSLAKLPEPGYKPRYADDRVGHFLSALKDFGSNDPDTNFVRQVNRWRLEKSDPKAKLSAPKKQVVWYVEDTVPYEYRPFVEAGIREWNKAFEKIGFREALAVRWAEPGRDEFDPEDINYCTFRWITTSGTYARSCLRADPITGEMIDGDVIFDASWIRYWKQEYAFLTGAPIPASTRDAAAAPPAPLAIGQVISPIMAIKQGFGLPVSWPLNRLKAASQHDGPTPELVPAESNALPLLLRGQMAHAPFSGCQFSTGMRPELGLAAIALAETPKGDADAGLPDELLGQLIKEVVMHEVGHSLGLRHNFKASSMLTADQLNDPAVTRVKGQTGSVMDYNPMNIAPKGQKQGDYITTTIGPYDYWAIEYAYKPIDGDEKAELRKIAEKSPDSDLVYATDEDMFLDNDPQVNAFDMGSDTLRFAKDRIALAAQLLKDVDSKVVKDGESWARVRHAFSILLNQWGNAAYLAASHIGGQSVSRDHKGSKGAKDPIIPVAGTKQREALALLVDHVLSDKAFQFSPALLRRLASERWYHWGNDGFFFFGGVDYPVNEQILRIQQIALNQCLAADVLARLQNQEIESDPGAPALRMSEVFRALTDGIWSELAGPADSSTSSGNGQSRSLACSTIRRNLQREHLRRLSTMVLGQRRSPFEDLYGFMFFYGGAQLPADAKSLARLHLHEIDGRIAKTLAAKDATIDDTTRAHLEEGRERIRKVLDARVDVNEP